MRDIALTGFILVLIPVILRRPWIGILVGAWISLMNPHRYTFGFAYDFPFAFVVALVTVVAMLFNRKEIEIPRHPIVYMLLTLMDKFGVPVDKVGGSNGKLDIDTLSEI